MENNSILTKIESIYVLKSIFEYLKKEKTLNLFVYSSFFQKKLDLKLSDYQSKYINRLGINYDKYLFDSSPNIDLAQMLEDDLLKVKIDRNIFILHMINYYQELINKINNCKNEDILNKYKIIDINSPFFGILSNTNLLEQFFTIHIKINLIEENNLINDYILAFKKLKNSNKKYSSIKIIYKDTRISDYINKFNININFIKRLEIIEDSDYLNYFKNYDNLFKHFLFLDTFKNNLLYLNLYSNIGQIYDIKFDDLNDFKSLRILKLRNFNFSIIFKINIKKDKIG